MRKRKEAQEVLRKDSLTIAKDSKASIEAEKIDGWHYLPVYKTVNGVKQYSVCEVYVDEAGKCITNTDSGIEPGGWDHKELVGDLELMLKDIRRYKPVEFNAVKPGVKFIKFKSAKPKGDQRKTRAALAAIEGKRRKA